MIPAGRSVYVVRTPPTGGSGAVSSVNAKTGTVSIVGALGIAVDNSGVAIVISAADMNEGNF